MGVRVPPFASLLIEKGWARFNLKVEVAVADAEQSRKDITIEVPAEQVKEEFDKTYSAYAKYAKVPGFRPGHVPINVVKQRFKKDARDDVIKEIIPHALEHAIVDNKLRPVGSPEIRDITVEEGQPLRFKAIIEVLPEFELKDYKGIKLTRRVSPVKDEAVDAVLEEWRQRSAQLVPVEERDSQKGDILSVNLKGRFVEEPDAEEIDSDGVEFELGGEGVPPEFTEYLTGVKAGDERKFRVPYPADFSEKDMAGKTVDFVATVVAVRIRELPELNDDFAKEHSQESLAEMREFLRKNLETRSRAFSDRELRNELFGKLNEAYDFPIPTSLVESDAENRMREFAYRLLRSGVRPESLRDMNWEEMRGQARATAMENVRTSLVVQRIADEEKIEVSQDEIDAEVARIAEDTGETEASIRAQLTKDERLSSIETRLRHEKAIESIIDKADITTEEITAPPDNPEIPEASETVGQATQPETT